MVFPASRKCWTFTGSSSSDVVLQRHWTIQRPVPLERDLGMLLAAVTHSANQELPPGILGFLLGGFIIGLVWMIVAFARKNVEHKHEKWVGDVLYSTKSAHRICGKIGDRIAEGHWIFWVKSLWRINERPPMYYNKPTKTFFVLTIDEFNPPHISPLTPENARKFIMAFAPQEQVQQLLYEWLGDKPSQRPSKDS